MEYPFLATYDEQGHMCNQRAALFLHKLDVIYIEGYKK